MDGEECRELSGGEIMENDPTAFLTKASDLVGRWETELFSQNVFCECQDLKIDSPIERLLYIALKTLGHVNYIQEANDPVEENGEWHVAGLHIAPQKKIGNYRIDFQLSYERKWCGVWEAKEILVECDSQEFHERTEKERRYEKQRDRFLISRGHTVLHFTGSEIVQNPWKVAAEVLEAVCTGKQTVDDLLGSLENYLD